MNVTRIIATVENEPIKEYDDGAVRYRGAGRVDTDGIGPHHGDPCADSDTSLHVNGHALNADVDKYIVVPIEIVLGTKGAVLGCLAHARNTRNDMETFAVVGDIGNRRKPPTTRLGEVSNATAAALGLDPSPTHGGTDSHIIEYTIWPGRAAEVDGKQYQLQPWGS